MADDISRDEMLDIVQTMLEGQLKAVNNLRKRTERPRWTSPQRKTNMQLVYDILDAAGRPLHIDEIVDVADKAHNRRLIRDSIVSALSKKVLSQRTFCRVGRNRFGLLGRDDHE